MKDFGKFTTKNFQDLAVWMDYLQENNDKASFHKFMYQLWLVSALYGRQLIKRYDNYLWDVDEAVNFLSETEGFLEKYGNFVQRLRDLAATVSVKRYLSLVNNSDRILSLINDAKILERSFGIPKGFLEFINLTVTILNRGKEVVNAW